MLTHNGTPEDFKHKTTNIKVVKLLIEYMQKSNCKKGLTV